MATTTMRAPRAFASSICQACRQRLLPSTTRRAFSTSPSHAAEPNDALSGLGLDTPSPSPARPAQSRGRGTGSPTTSISEILDSDQESFLNQAFHDEVNNSSTDEPHRMHIYATKHNTHITLVQPSKAAYLTASSGISRTSASAADQKKQIDTLISLSAGNIGFRKAGRGSYDAAYQLGAFVCKQIQEKGMLRDIRGLQVVLRGFGAGREAVTKVLLGSEGRFIRGRIESVVDATRLKQGGARSKKPRRLG